MYYESLNMYIHISQGKKRKKKHFVTKIIYAYKYRTALINKNILEGKKTTLVELF